MDDLHAWLLEEQPKHVPKGPLGMAISYALNQWDRLLCFLDNVHIPVDNQKDSIWVTLLFNFAPFVLIIAVIAFFMNQAQGGGNRVMSFGKARPKMVNKDTPISAQVARILLREADLDGPLVAGARARQLLLEAGDQAPGAEHPSSRNTVSASAYSGSDSAQACGRHLAGDIDALDLGVGGVAAPPRPLF